jgi:hypothetical protein
MSISGPVEEISADGVVARHHAAPAEAITSATAARTINFVVILVPKGFIFDFSFWLGFFHFICEAIASAL